MKLWKMLRESKVNSKLWSPVEQKSEQKIELVASKRAKLVLFLL